MPQPTPKSRDVQTIQAQIEIARRRSRNPHDGFKWFVNNVFSASFHEFIQGEYIDDTCENMQDNLWTMDVSARDHFKSTRLYAEIMHDIFTAERNVEGFYFSYSMDMSRYHLKKIKQMIMDNPFFATTVDNKRLAEGVLDYTNSAGATVTCTPSGLLIFKRGIHADRIYIDDPLKDPENKLAPTVIYKINRVIKTEIYAMVNKGGRCRVVGTPQTNNDFFFDVELQNKFVVRIRPAIVDELNHIALFPEWKSYEELCEIRETIGVKPFNQEYMTQPSYSENSYIERASLEAVIDKDLKSVIGYTGDNDVVAGFDIGKKTHPAHLVIYERWRTPEGKFMYKQLLSKWFDKVEYKAQLEYLLLAKELYKIDKLRYDNTRGEFEGFKEQGLVPREFEPVTFSMKTNNAMAVSMDAVIGEGRVTLVNDTRQTDQILQVNNELQAIESPMGHGDSFWSNALALWEERQHRYGVRS